MYCLRVVPSLDRSWPRRHWQTQTQRQVRYRADSESANLCTASRLSFLSVEGLGPQNWLSHRAWDSLSGTAVALISKARGDGKEEEKKARESNKWNSHISSPCQRKRSVAAKFYMYLSERWSLSTKIKYTVHPGYCIPIYRNIITSQTSCFLPIILCL